MQIKINGRNHEFLEETLTITEVMQKLNYTFNVILVKYKNEVIRKEQFDCVRLTDGDEILFIHMFAGG
jgi:thiamine biosynthesis protein ThiS